MIHTADSIPTRTSMHLSVHHNLRHIYVLINIKKKNVFIKIFGGYLIVQTTPLLSAAEYLVLTNAVHILSTLKFLRAALGSHIPVCSVLYTYIL